MKPRLRTLIPRAALLLPLFLPSAAQADYASDVLSLSPMAYWRMGDAGSTFLDSTANAHNGVADVGLQSGFGGLIINDPTNTAIRITGGATSPRITVPAWDKYAAASTGFSAEYWIQPEAMPAAFINILGDGNSAGSFYMMNYFSSTGIVRPHFGSNNSPVSVDSSVALAIGSTYHVVTTWDRATGAGRVYINGLLKGSVTTSLNLPANDTNPMFIGRDNRGDNGTGASFLLDEVAFYDKPLSLAQIRQHYTSGSGQTVVVPPPLGTLRHSFTFDEASSGTTNALDSKGTLVGTFTGAGTTRVPGLAGSTGALSMNNTNGGVSVSMPLNLPSGEGFSIVARVDANWTGNAGDYDEVMRQNNGSLFLFSLQNDSNNPGAQPAVPAGPVLSLGMVVGGVYNELDMPLDGQSGGAGGNANVRPTVAQFNDGTHLLAGTYDVATGTKGIWFDGQLLWSFDGADGAGFAIGSTGPAFIGSSSGGEAWNGTIDLVNIYDRAVDTTDLALVGVPEPGSAALLLFGGALMGLRRRRR